MMMQTQTSVSNCSFVETLWHVPVLQREVKQLKETISHLQVDKDELHARLLGKVTSC